jgi:hypothetical protein
MKSQKQKERDSIQQFRVPNDADGQRFLQDLKKYAIAGTRILVRGRGPRAAKARANGQWPGRWRQELPHAFAEYFAVYISKTRFRTETVERLQELKDSYYKKPEITVQDLRQIQRIDGRLLVLNTRRSINLKENN